MNIYIYMYIYMYMYIRIYLYICMYVYRTRTTRKCGACCAWWRARSTSLMRLRWL